MRISVTGKGNTGYTLLEVLGVILLIGLVLSLVRPEFPRFEERNRLRYVGELIQADLKTAQDQTKTGNVVRVHFNPYGYRFKIGDTLIMRDFKSYGVNFILPSAAEAESETELLFATDGSCQPIALDWEGQHFQGTLAIKPDGTVSWNYHAK
ncbi:MAG TPA: hypothetical protein VEC37_18895 [Bacillota bacterium]|nr:hypothetical protein [Bacillota bacterium]